MPVRSVALIARNPPNQISARGDAELDAGSTGSAMTEPLRARAVISVRAADVAAGDAAGSGISHAGTSRLRGTTAAAANTAATSTAWRSAAERRRSDAAISRPAASTIDERTNTSKRTVI